MRVRVLLLVGVPLLACAVFVGPAAGKWHSTGHSGHHSHAPVSRRLVPPSVDVLTPQVVVAPDGEAVAAWARGVPEMVPAALGTRSHAAGHGGSIEVAAGRIGTGLSRPQVLARLKTRGNSPLLAGDHGGDAIVAWTDDRGRLVYSARPTGGSFGSIRVLAPSGGLWSVVGGHGHLFAAAWTSSHGGPDAKIFIATGTPAKGFGPPVALSAPEPSRVTLDLNSHGSVLVLDEESRGRAQVWLRPAGATFKLVGRLQQGNGGISAALRPDDSIIALINGPDADLPGVSATYWRPGGKFSRPKVLARDGEFTDVAVDGRGKTTAIWGLYGAQGNPVGATYATAPVGRPFGPPRRKRRRGGYPGALAASESGRRLVMWEQNFHGGQTSFLRFARFSRSGNRLGRLHTVVRTAVSEHAAAIGDDGRGLLIWTADDGHGHERGVFYAKLG